MTLAHLAAQALPPLHMRWERVCFLNWPCPAALLAAALPPGLEPDRHGGQAYLEVVALRIAGFVPVGWPQAAALRPFAELNLRAPVRGPQGPGVWFFSLDAAHAPAATLARAITGLPYRPARVGLFERGGAHAFLSRHSRFAFAGAYAPRGGPFRAVPGSLEYFLTERYRLYSVHGGRLLSAPVRHEPWPLHRGTAEVRLSLPGSPFAEVLRGEPGAVPHPGLSVLSGRFAPA